LVLDIEQHNEKEHTVFLAVFEIGFIPILPFREHIGNDYTSFPAA
jgi:hypothetical protein